MTPIVAIDARDAFAPELRGVEGATLASSSTPCPSGPSSTTGSSLPRGRPRPRGALGAGRLAAAPARHARPVHAPNCFLPLRRPCPGVVTVHDLAFEAYPDDFSTRRPEYRTFAPRAVRSAERMICVSGFTADDVVARYGVDPARCA